MRRAAAALAAFSMLAAVPGAAWQLRASPQQGGRGSGSGGGSRPHHGDPILHWNAVALQAVVDDHTGTFGPAEHGGPTRAARTLAIVHLAMYDALNAVEGSHRPYLPVSAPTRGASIDAAVARAAHDALATLYVNQLAVFDAELRRALANIPRHPRRLGEAVGAEAATNILSARDNDGADQGQVPIYPGTDPNDPLPGQHLPDPVYPNQGLLTPGWGRVTTFSGIDVTAAAIRCPAPPALGSAAYAEAYNDVLTLGGDGVSTPTLRTDEQTEIGIFWAYDGTPGVGPPPVLYNQVLRVIAGQQRNSAAQNARLFALANMAMADSGVAAWDSKYFYNVWRPVIGIRGGASDGNGATDGYPAWLPLGAPASNLVQPNFTPAFPAYPSGHATFGAALFRTLQTFYGRDDIGFRMGSDELNGVTTDNEGNVRPVVRRKFRSFTEAMQENARSRIYLGVHWQFDADSGMDQGATIADAVTSGFLRPRR